MDTSLKQSLTAASSEGTAIPSSALERRRLSTLVRLEANGCLLGGLGAPQSSAGPWGSSSLARSHSSPIAWSGEAQSLAAVSPPGPAELCPEVRCCSRALFILLPLQTVITGLLPSTSAGVACYLCPTRLEPGIKRGEAACLWPS